MGEFELGVLTPNQAQGVGVALRRLERTLFSIEALYMRREETREGAIVSLVNPLTDEQGAELANLVGQARASIATLAGRFGLQHETSDLAREAHGRLVEMWTALEDTKSTKLRRYGRVDPALSASLDPEIEQLIHLVIAMDKEIVARTT
jgi:hypothetical protein